MKVSEQTQTLSDPVPVTLTYMLGLCSVVHRPTAPSCDSTGELQQYLQVLVCVVLCTAANISTRAFVSSLVFVTPHTCLCFSFLVNKIMFSNLARLVSRHCHWLCGSL